MFINRVHVVPLHSRRKPIVAIAAALIVAVAAYGFAASNTVAVSNAGDGNSTISGYNVSNVTYVLNSTDPSTIDSVSMAVAAQNGGTAPTTVKVQLVTGGAWFSATSTDGGSTWTADVTGGNITATAVNNLRVVAAN